MPEQKRFAVYDLTDKRTRSIGIFVHRLDSGFIISALRGIEKVITERGYHSVILHSQDSIEKEGANTKLLFHRSVDGVLASLTVDTAGAGGVIIDNSRCGYLATEHLIRQGCKRIVLVTSTLKQHSNVRQYMGFRQALKRYDMMQAGDLLIAEEIEGDAGADVARKVLRMDPLPDGLFITDDRAAAMCMHTLKEAGVRVPDDIAIVGFSNDPVGRLITPALTTIDCPGFEIGKTAALALLDRLSGLGAAGQRMTAVVPPALIVRKSSVRNQLSAGGEKKSI